MADTLKERIEKANKYLERFRRDGVLNHINGHSVAADDGTTFDVISPVDLKVIAKAAHNFLACIGESFMHNTSMTLDVLGGENDKGKAEFVTELFASSGTGQVNAVMSLD